MDCLAIEVPPEDQELEWEKKDLKGSLNNRVQRTVQSEVTSLTVSVRLTILRLSERHRNWVLFRRFPSQTVFVTDHSGGQRCFQAGSFTVAGVGAMAKGHRPFWVAR